MRKLGVQIQYAIAEMSGDSETARINIRARQVRERYRRALEAVYRDTAGLFLAHTNNVFIMDKNGVRTLIVYVDESIFAAELNAQRELIRLKLLELFNEQVVNFEIYVSRPQHKNHHPYVEEAEGDSIRPAADYRKIPLDEEEKSFVSATVSHVDDSRLRAALEKAMTADLEWKKGKKEK